MSEHTMVRLRKTTDKKVVKLQKKMNQERLTHINKGETIDIAVTEKLEGKGDQNG